MSNRKPDEWSESNETVEESIARLPGRLRWGMSHQQAQSERWAWEWMLAVQQRRTVRAPPTYWVPWSELDIWADIVCLERVVEWPRTS